MKASLRTAAWWFFALLSTLGWASKVAEANAHDAPQPFASVTEVHQILVSMQLAQNQSTGQRHEEERTRLLKSFDRRSGKWTTNHPRHRLLDALHGFLRYRTRQAGELTRLRNLYKGVSKSQRALLEHHLSYSSNFDKVERKLHRNQALCDAIVDSALLFYGLDFSDLASHAREREAAGHLAERTAVSQALKHIVRDWTAEGEHERNVTFSCMLRSLNQLFPTRQALAPVKILLPGAGLGRLGHEIHRLGGFEVTMNEWSMYMNVVYRYLEEHGRMHENTFSPFVDGWSHHAANEDMFRELHFPDTNVDPKSVLMVEGDFITAFSAQEGHYDVVLTYFFIDTARNLMSYFDTIKKVLRRGGYWINLGPLLYGTGPFVQLSLEEIIKVTEAMGFEYQETDETCGPLTFENATVRSMEAIYGFDKKALTKSSYNAQFWVAKRL
ncbi:hypothetical protein DCS_03566 [Drechmeria coniospora]|uniref:Uncharacterized protein n=1 Tax=Drechmeria coniospora TaxID=98403 RepID=A0A151GHK5_DRECN|nr:hypothetical protein DCS_03566 [Drechmeria coniospora]KYK56566.1 hypothetical protein DCS_03566 [Drechmeria coniospora]ODA77005.1 hypothetical protein RJ55_07522 [Drechmeria coniospora]